MTDLGLSMVMTGMLRMQQMQDEVVWRLQGCFFIFMTYGTTCNK